MSDGAFSELVQRIRQGDQEAATQLVRQYEPAIRRVVRFRMADTRLSSAFDSMDICQSVLASFFVRAASGQFDLKEPRQLLQLLTDMARKKLATQVRNQRAARRDNRRVAATAAEEHALPDGEATPSRHMAARELLEEVHRRLAPDERQLMELRNQGLEWNDIASRLGESAEALRKRLARAIEQIASDLKLDEGGVILL
jgi:RNA polymerase sigma-70 factor (ECF subfamily)